MTLHKFFHPKNDIDGWCREKKKEEEDSPVLRIIHKKCPERLITRASNNNVNINNLGTNSKTTKSTKQKWSENNCIDTSSNKLKRDSTWNFGKRAVMRHFS